jgi:hypothetical protein
LQVHPDVAQRALSNEIQTVKKPAYAETASAGAALLRSLSFGGRGQIRTDDLKITGQNILDCVLSAKQKRIRFENASRAVADVAQCALSNEIQTVKKQKARLRRNCFGGRGPPSLFELRRARPDSN